MYSLFLDDDHHHLSLADETKAIGVAMRSHDTAYTVRRSGGVRTVLPPPLQPPQPRLADVKPTQQPRRQRNRLHDLQLHGKFARYDADNTYLGVPPSGSSRDDNTDEALPADEKSRGPAPLLTAALPLPAFTEPRRDAGAARQLEKEKEVLGRCLEGIGNTEKLFLELQETVALQNSWTIAERDELLWRADNYLHELTLDDRFLQDEHQRLTSAGLYNQLRSAWQDARQALTRARTLGDTVTNAIKAIKPKNLAASSAGAASSPAPVTVVQVLPRRAWPKRDDESVMEWLKRLETLVGDLTAEDRALGLAVEKPLQPIFDNPAAPSNDDREKLEKARQTLTSYVGLRTLEAELHAAYKLTEGTIKAGETTQVRDESRRILKLMDDAYRSLVRARTGLLNQVEEKLAQRSPPLLPSSTPASASTLPASKHTAVAAPTAATAATSTSPATSSAAASTLSTSSNTPAASSPAAAAAASPTTAPGLRQTAPREWKKRDTETVMEWLQRLVALHDDLKEQYMSIAKSVATPIQPVLAKATPPTPDERKKLDIAKRILESDVTLHRLEQELDGAYRLAAATDVRGEEVDVRRKVHRFLGIMHDDYAMLVGGHNTMLDDINEKLRQQP